MIYAVTTRTGAIYVIDKDHNLWCKLRKSVHSIISNSYYYYDEHSLTTLTELKAGTEMRYPHEFTEETWEDVDVPVAGKYMYIAGPRPYEWFVATKIQKVAVLESFDIENLTDENLAGTVIDDITIPSASK